MHHPVPRQAHSARKPCRKDIVHNIEHHSINNYTLPSTPSHPPGIAGSSRTLVASSGIRQRQTANQTDALSNEVAALQETIKGLKSQLTSMHRRVTEAEEKSELTNTKMTAMRARVFNLEKGFAAHTEQIEAIEERLTETPVSEITTVPVTATMYKGMKILVQRRHRNLATTISSGEHETQLGLHRRLQKRQE
jgi:chromosome segregation ATPase